MKGESWLAKILLIVLSITSTSVTSTTTIDRLTVGYRVYGDEMIDDYEETNKGKADYVFTYSKTYAGDNHRIITQIDIDNLAGSETYAAISAGGPDNTFVSISYTLPRLTEMKYKVTLWGKRPPFRKIP